MTDNEAFQVKYILDKILFFQENKSNTERRVNYNIHTCFSYLILLISQLKNFPKHKYTPKSNYNLRTKKIIAYIENNLAKKISLDELASMFFISKTALCKDFKKNTTTTIANYIFRARLEKACHYLKFTNKNMDNIAELTGFGSGAYFYYVFNKFYNITPTKYRKKYKAYESKNV